MAYLVSFINLELISNTIKLEALIAAALVVSS